MNVAIKTPALSAKLFIALCCAVFLSFGTVGSTTAFALSGDQGSASAHISKHKGSSETKASAKSAVEHIDAADVKETPASTLGLSKDDENISIAKVTKGTVYAYYDSERGEHIVVMKSATISGSIKTLDKSGLAIYCSGTCYVKGGIDSWNTFITRNEGASSSTLYVYGGVYADDLYVTGDVDYPDEDTVTVKGSFILKSYNTAKTVTRDGINVDFLEVAPGAKIYTYGYKKSSPYGIGVNANRVAVEEKGYLNASGKRFGVWTDYLLVEKGTLYAKQTSSTPKSHRYDSDRYLAIRADSFGAEKAKITAYATGKYSTAIDANEEIVIGYSTVKAYAKNRGYAIQCHEASITFLDTNLTAWGGGAGLVSRSEEDPIYFAGGKLYIYGKNKKGTRTGSGIVAKSPVALASVSYAKVYAKKGSSYNGIRAPRIQVLGSKLYVYAKKNHALNGSPNGVLIDDDSVVKVNGYRKYGFATAF